MKISLHFLFTMTLFFEMNLQGYQPSRGSELVDEIITKTAKDVKKEFGLQPCGSGASMPGGPIKKINLSFDSRNAYCRNELREFLIKITQKIVHEVNSNEEIQQYLLIRPFNEKNVEIAIFNHDAKGGELFDPYICGAGISPEGLIYRTSDSENPLQYKNRYRESYEEALKLLKK